MFDLLGRDSHLAGRLRQRWDGLRGFSQSATVGAAAVAAEAEVAQAEVPEEAEFVEAEVAEVQVSEAAMDLSRLDYHEFAEPVGLRFCAWFPPRFAF